MSVVNMDQSAAPAGELARPVALPSRLTFRAVWHYGLQVVSLGLFFGVGLLITLAAPVIQFALGPRSALPVGRAMIRGMFRFYSWWLRSLGLFRVRFEGEERLSQCSGVIVAPNHPGLLDAIFLISVLPRAVCIMRAGLMRHPSFSGAARLAGFITNDRGAGLVRACREKLAAGDNLLIFPEGTRTRSHMHSVNPFKGGCALAAVTSGAPIQTVLIERSGVYLGKETSLAAAAKIPIEMTIRLGDVFHAEPGETAKHLSARLETYFRERLDNGAQGVRVKC